MWYILAYVSVFQNVTAIAGRQGQTCIRKGLPYWSHDRTDVDHPQ